MNENDSCGLRCLTIWYPVGDFWVGLGVVALAMEEVGHLGVGFEVLKPCAIPNTLCLLLSVEDIYALLAAPAVISPSCD